MRDDLSLLRSRHFDDPFNKGYCAEDAMMWPCDAIRVLDAYEALKAEIERLNDYIDEREWQDRCEAERMGLRRDDHYR